MPDELLEQFAATLAQVLQAHEFLIELEKEN